MKKLTKLMFILAQLGFVGALQAATVSLDPTSQVVLPNSSVSVDVVVDFTEGTKGGVFTLGYDDSLLTFSSFDYDLGFLSSFGATANVLDSSAPGTITGIGFGGGLFDGAGVIGTVTFLTGASTGTALLTTSFAGGFLNSSGFGLLPVTYGGASVTAVPVPAAAWLMASGLGMLGLGLRRRSV